MEPASPVEPLDRSEFGPFPLVEEATDEVHDADDEEAFDRKDSAEDRDPFAEAEDLAARMRAMWANAPASSEAEDENAATVESPPAVGSPDDLEPGQLADEWQTWQPKSWGDSGLDDEGAGEAPEPEADAPGSETTRAQELSTDSATVIWDLDQEADEDNVERAQPELAEPQALAEGETAAHAAIESRLSVESVESIEEFDGSSEGIETEATPEALHEAAADAIAEASAPESIVAAEADERAFARATGMDTEEQELESKQAPHIEAVTPEVVEDPLEDEVIDSTIPASVGPLLEQESPAEVMDDHFADALLELADSELLVRPETPQEQVAKPDEAEEDSLEAALAAWGADEAEVLEVLDGEGKVPAPAKEAEAGDDEVAVPVEIDEAPQHLGEEETVATEEPEATPTEILPEAEAAEEEHTAPQTLSVMDLEALSPAAGSLLEEDTWEAERAEEPFADTPSEESVPAEDPETALPEVASSGAEVSAFTEAPSDAPAIEPEPSEDAAALHEVAAAEFERATLEALQEQEQDEPELLIVEDFLTEVVGEETLWEEDESELLAMEEALVHEIIEELPAEAPELVLDIVDSRVPQELVAEEVVGEEALQAQEVDAPDSVDEIAAEERSEESPAEAPEFVLDTVDSRVPQELVAEEVVGEEALQAQEVDAPDFGDEIAAEERSEESPAEADALELASSDHAEQPERTTAEAIDADTPAPPRSGSPGSSPRRRTLRGSAYCGSATRARGAGRHRPS